MEVAGRRNRGDAKPSPRSIGPSGLEAPLTHIDWNVELRKIEREFDGLPPEPTPAERRQLREAELQEEEEHKSGAFGVYVRLSLVLSLCLGMFSWPYDVSCGASLLGYMSAVATVVLGGLWTSLSTWRHGMGKSHIVSLLVLTCGVVLAAAQVLPRVGYAAPSPDRATTWRCGG
jgi:hypothetical protein